MSGFSTIMGDFVGRCGEMAIASWKEEVICKPYLV